MLTKRKKITAVFFTLLLTAVISLWVFCPLVNMKSVFWIEDEDGTIDLDYYKSAVTDSEAALQQITKEQFFPSDEIKDYCTVVVGISALNISIFNLTDLDLIIDYQNEKLNGFFVFPPIFPSEQGHRFSKVQERYMTSFLVYRNGKTDEEIISELQNIEVILTYETLIKSYSKRMKLGDLSYQLMDDWYSYPKGWDVPVDEIPEGAEIIE